MEALQAELAKIQAEQDALPALVKEVQEALEAEAAAFQRQEAGGHLVRGGHAAAMRTS